MLVHIFLGVLATLAFVWILNFVRKTGKAMAWWEWGLTILGLIYSAFVLELIYAFLVEGAVQAAALNGGITALIAVIWVVLMNRFVFSARGA